ncbi:MAG: hypothetical protein HW414_1742, partial [Dehalococcoidia bacterium]|nr:hypothetical protein [Dehalococcoidia bacterium]
RYIIRLSIQQRLTASLPSFPMEVHNPKWNGIQ